MFIEKTVRTGAGDDPADRMNGDISREISRRKWEEPYYEKRFDRTCNDP